VIEMGSKRKPKSGSMAVRPRKRAKELTPRLKHFHALKKKGLLAYPVYKVGMKRCIMIDDSTGPAKGMEITTPVTLVEAPKITVFGIRCYGKNYTGEKVLFDIISSQPEIRGKLGMKKDGNKITIEEIEKRKNEITRLAVLSFTHPETCGFGKKNFDIVEIPMGGSLDEQISYAKEIFEKEISPLEALSEGEFVDVIGVTKGKGWQGPIKRFGVAKQRRKATGKVRHVGTLGPWHPPYVMYTTPMAGQMGFHRRTQRNIRVLKISDEKDENFKKELEKLNKGGFKHYGIIKTNFLILKGSVQGPPKRFLLLRKTSEFAAKPNLIDII
jgi:large subunit ribosomal protein L3